MEKDLLLNAGLSEDEAMVYQFLLAQGGSTAGQVIKGVGLKRGHVYNILKSLVLKNLVEQSERGKVAFFQLDHPTRLFQHVQQRVRGMQQAERALKEVFPDLVSEFNISHHKPGVYYYEGMLGIKQVLDDSLTAKETILTYADIEAIEKYIRDVNEEYVANREKLGIKKRALILDTPFAREKLKDYHPEVTDIKFVPATVAPFHTVMQVYDGRTSYISLSDERMLGIIIEDESIYRMNKFLIGNLWDQAE
jgi:sugar-specific transcriptional regulator TrmB